MKKFLFLTLSFFTLNGFSQYRWDVGARLGVSNYVGEIGGELETRKNFLADLNFAETKFACSAFARHKLIRQISLKGAITYLRIAGADSYSQNPGRVGRNLSFRNDIFDLTVGGQYFFYEINDLGRTYRYRNDFRAYVYSGISTFFHAPKAEYDGKWYYLRRLKTEGQVKPYSPLGLAFPLGIGLYFTVEKRYRIGWELSWRKTFTDYLDDISTKFADTTLFTDPIAKSLSNRRLELSEDQANVPHPANYTPGNKRGDPSHKDAYMFTTFNFSYVFRGKSSFYRSRYSSIFKGSRYKKRGVRAKF